MVDYVLKQNEFFTEGRKYRAQVVNSRSYTFDDIAKYLIKHNTGLSKTVIYGLWEGIKDAVEEFISDGGVINTELFRVSASIKGNFDGMEDGFDGSRHKIKLNLRPGLLLQDIPNRIKIKKLPAADATYIISVTDIKTGTVDDRLTPGKNIRIFGQRVKIDGNDPENGVYFIPAASTAKPVKIGIPDLVINKPSQIIAVIPPLTKGRWKLRLITQYSRSRQYLKTPRSVTYEKEFSIA